MKELTDTEKKIITMISGEIEDYTVDLLTRQDNEIMDWEKQAPSDVVFTNGVFKIRERYYLEFCHWLKGHWDALSWDEQIVFCQYFYQQNIVLEWMDECQITALRLIQ